MEITPQSRGKSYVGYLVAASATCLDLLDKESWDVLGPMADKMLERVTELRNMADAQAHLDRKGRKV